MPAHPLLDVTAIPRVEPYLRDVGEVFRVFGEQDSGCVSYGVRLPDGERLFVKEATDCRAQRSLDRAWAFHRRVRHPAIVPQLHRVAVGGRRTAMVMPWHEGEILYDRTARARFHALPLARVHRVLDRVLDAHLAVEAVGQVAVDLYDGAFLYDFDGHEMHLIDLDEYCLPGSTRFMAPEEWRYGATIAGSVVTLKEPSFTPS